MIPLIISGVHTGTKQQRARTKGRGRGTPVGNPGLVTTKKEISVPASCESW